ncbi:MAG TPA: M20 family metallopeptidase [Streptosporangiaceae bacterium]|nr:M20 family metallopeptidase [Streptosporangiaceae bacterium]
MGEIRDDATRISGDLIELRRAIHADPEIGLDLPRTQEKVLAALDGLPLEVTTGQALSSVTAVLRGARPGGTVLLRGDMDALPVTEATGLPYASRNDGAMHACGHDLHTSMLAGAARLLSARQGGLAGNVIFMFQPGEESYGGAERMISEGILDAAGSRPVAAFGLHVASGLLPLGMLTSRDGTMMASADTMEVTVKGRGGHGSQPHRAADPVPAACEIVTALQTLVTRRFDVFDPVVITVGSFHAGTASNVIPDRAHFSATMRSFSASTRTAMQDAAYRLVHDIASGHGLSATADFVDSYPVTVNDAAEVAFAEATIAELFGGERFLRTPFPLTGSEDFSYVLNEVPGAFVMLGACPPDADPATAPFNHSAEAVFDDAVLADGATLLAELALRKLAG